MPKVITYGGGGGVKSVQEAKLLQCACPEYYAYISV